MEKKNGKFLSCLKYNWYVACSLQYAEIQSPCLASIAHTFCEKERNRPRTRRRNIEREYHPIQIEEILNNVPGSTDRIIEYVNGDEEQLKKIAAQAF